MDQNYLQKGLVASQRRRSECNEEEEENSPATSRRLTPSKFSQPTKVKIKRCPPNSSVGNAKPEWVGVGDEQEQKTISQCPPKKISNTKPHVQKKQWVTPNMEENESTDRPDSSLSINAKSHKPQSNAETPSRMISTGAGIETSRGLQKHKVSNQHDVEALLEEIANLKKDNSTLRQRLDEIETAYNAVLSMHSVKPKSSTPASVALQAQAQILRLKSAQISQMHRQIRIQADALDRYNQVFDDAEGLLTGEPRKKLQEIRKTVAQIGHSQIHFGQKEGKFISNNNVNRRPSQICSVTRFTVADLHQSPELLENLASIAHLNPASVGKLEEKLMAAVVCLIQFVEKLRSETQESSTDTGNDTGKSFSSQCIPLPMGFWKESLQLVQELSLVLEELAAFRALNNSEQFVQSKGFPDFESLLKGTVQKTKEGRITLLKILIGLEAERNAAQHQVQLWEAEARVFRKVLPSFTDASQRVIKETNSTFNKLISKFQQSILGPLQEIVECFEGFQLSSHYGSYMKGLMGPDVAEFLITVESHAGLLKEGCHKLNDQIFSSDITLADCEEIFKSELNFVLEKLSASRINL